VFISDEIFHGVGDFVVEDMFLGDDVRTAETEEECVVSSNHFGILSAFHWFNQDATAVDLNEHHDVSVAGERAGGKLASLVGEDGFSDIVDFGVDVTEFLATE
jgi:hypothetical protein